MKMVWIVILGAFLQALAGNEPARGASEAPPPLRLYVTKTASDTGIYAWILEDFQKIHPDLSVQMRTAGSLEVLDKARQGKADLVIVHHSPSERLFMAQGYGQIRTQIMFDEFAIFGPPTKTKEISKITDVREVMRNLASEEVAFYSPSSSSGTYAKLMDLWIAAGVEPTWINHYLTGESTSLALKQAALFNGYAFANMATYLMHRSDLKDKLIPLYRDDAVLRNYYSAILVKKNIIPEGNYSAAQALHDYLVSDRGQARIAAYSKYDTNLFTPAAIFDAGLRAKRAEEKLRSRTLLNDLLTALLAVILISAIGIGVYGYRSHRYERLYRASSERFHHAIAGSNDGIWDWNVEKNIASVSSRFNEIMGLDSQSEVHSDPLSTWKKYIHPEDQESVIADFKGYIEDGDSSNQFHREFRLVKADGAVRWALLRGKALNDAHGELIRVCGSLTDITELKDMPTLSPTLNDPLTGLPNRLLLVDRLNQMLLMCNRDNAHSAIILVNVANLEKINETYGSLVGDRVLKISSVILKNKLRSSDTVARYRGNKFIVLLPNCDKDTALSFVRKVHAGLEHGFDIGDHQIKTEFNIGVSIFPEHGEDANTLIEHAMLAMLAATRVNSSYKIYNHNVFKSVSRIHS